MPSIPLPAFLQGVGKNYVYEHSSIRTLETVPSFPLFERSRAEQLKVKHASKVLISLSCKEQRLTPCLPHLSLCTVANTRPKAFFLPPLTFSR